MDKTLQMVGRISRVPAYRPAAVRKLMAALDLNEKGFALLMNVTPKTVRLWATGAAQPCGAACRLMQLYEVCPSAVVKLAAEGAEKPGKC